MKARIIKAVVQFLIQTARIKLLNDPLCLNGASFGNGEKDVRELLRKLYLIARLIIHLAASRGIKFIRLKVACVFAECTDLSILFASFGHPARVFNR